MKSKRDSPAAAVGVAIVFLIVGVVLVQPLLEGESASAQMRRRDAQQMRLLDHTVVTRTLEHETYSAELLAAVLRGIAEEMGSESLRSQSLGTFFRFNPMKEAWWPGPSGYSDPPPITVVAVDEAGVARFGRAAGGGLVSFDEQSQPAWLHDAVFPSGLE